MRRAASAVGAALVALGISSQAWAADFVVDPVNGDMSGDGSADSPWSTLQEVLDAGLVETQEWASLPYEQGAELVAKNPGAPVTAGDTLWLRSGYHGEVLIESAYNTDFITVAAEEGHNPQFSRVHVRSSSHWILRGLEISQELAAAYEQTTLVDLESHSWRGPIHDIVVEDCTLSSVADASGWSAADWDQLACTGFQVDGTRMTVRNNHLTNVNFGISVVATHSLIEHNVVENFSGDGMRGLGGYTTFQYNTVKNCYAVNANHDDGFQSWSVGSDGEVGTGEVVGIVLRGNLILNYEDPNQPHRGTLQGIGCFDGMFVDWVVENNVVITDHWHGITLSGARNSRIVNNTVLDLNDQDPGPPWIRIGDHKDGTPSEGSVVRNNLTTALNIDEGPGVVEDHNLIIEDPAALFVDVDAHDLHLLENAPAVDAGSSDGAPELDIERIPRPQGDGVDIGAYEWHTEDVLPVPASGGGPAVGGSGGAGTAGGAGSGGTEQSSGDSEDEGGCGCRVPAAPPGAPKLLGLLALGVLVGLKARLRLFDRASRRQRRRQGAKRRRARQRGWTREELYDRGRGTSDAVGLPR